MLGKGWSVVARIRYIKPGFFMNDTLGALPPLARLLFVGLWTLADREGRLEDRPLRIKMQVLPYDSVNVDRLLAQLASAAFIIRYDVGGAAYIQIVNFLKHQQPHYKEVLSEIPAPPGHSDSLYVVAGVDSEQVARVLKRDHRQCVICATKDALSVDHVVPRSKGGTNDDTNLQTLCRACNSAKGNRNVGSTSGQRRLDDDLINERPDPQGMGNGEWGEGRGSPPNGERATEGAGAADSVLALLSKNFANGLGMLSVGVEDELRDWSERIPANGRGEKCVEYAFREAAAQNHRSWSYVAAILTRLEAEGWPAEPETVAPQGKAEVDWLERRYERGKA